jgi:ABC-type transport system substrate-binding protein
MQSYWNKVLDRRITRRRAIAATGMTAGAAAFLAACGGDDDDDGGEQAASRDTSGLLSNREQVKAGDRVRGGKLVIDNGSNRDPLHWDGKAQGQIQLNQFQGIAYEALVRNPGGPAGQPSSWSDVVPQLAESWEMSDDKLQITFKLRQGVQWQDKAPVSGREFVAEDVLKSWDYFIASDSPNNKASSANSINPAAPIVSWEAPDDYTLILNLSEPTSMIFQRLASMITGEVGSIYPMEIGDTFDAEQDQIGTGGWQLDSFEPSVSIKYKAHPNYWDRENSALFDEIELILLAEYAQKLAQFESGEIPVISRGVASTDVLNTKNKVPDLHMYSYVAASNSPAHSMRFGWDDIGGGPSPFLDQRVRQALSMCLDRDGYIEAFYDVSKFQGEGLPVDTYYYTQMGYVPNWTLDPRHTEEFGENAKFYEYNVAEAQKLKDAAEADYPGGKFPSFVTGRVNAVFGPTYAEQVEVMDQFARDIGFEIEAYPLDYNLDYLPKVVTQTGHFKIEDMGWAYAIGAVTSPDPTDLWVWRYYSKAGVTSGQLGLGTPGGPAGGSGDSEIDRMIEAAKGEFDANKRLEIIHDLQRYASSQIYNVPQPGTADGFRLAWPRLRNFLGYQNDSRVAMYDMHGLHTMWLDDSMA